MSIAAYLAKLSEGVNSSGILATSKGGTGTTSGGAFPTITSISYGGDNNDTATDTSGGRTVTITGANFAANATILINGVAAPVVSVVSASTITFTTPAMAAGTYVLYMVNADGSTAIAVPGISYSGVPAWSTAAGTVATATETLAISASLSATSNSAVTLSVLSGTLPPGAVFNSNGTISGTSAITASPTTYTFTVRATDTELQDTDRQFSIVINPDVITFTNPVGSSTVTLNQNENNFVTLAATTTTGNTIASYSADTLPPGMTLTGSTVSGVPTTLGTTSTTLTATSSTTAKTGTSTFTWSVIVGGDLYWKNTTLLLPGTALADNFVTDYSVNNFQPTIFGDTRASPLNPYQAGYYSNQFNGSGDYLTIPHNTQLDLSSGDYTIEAWVYWSGANAAAKIVGKDGVSGNALPSYALAIASSKIVFSVGTGNATSYYQAVTPASTTFPVNTWTHVAGVRSGTTLTVYQNGVNVASATQTSTVTDGGKVVYIGYESSQSATSYWGGNISNVRIVKGTAVYTTNFTPSTTPLTAISGTTLLTCQSNQFRDAGPNNFAITTAGTPSVQPFNPFGVPTTVTVNNLYSAYLTNATDSRLTVPAGTAFAYGTGDFTVESWFFVPDMTASSIRIIFSQTVSGTNYFVMGPQSSGSVLTGKIAFTGTGSGGGTEILSGSNLFTAGTWNHFAVCRVSGTVTVYLNGVGGTPTANATDFSNTSLVPTIGGYTHGTAQNFNGYISNLRVVKGTAVYTSNFTPATTNLTAISGTSLLTFQDATIRDNSASALTITNVGTARLVAQSPFTQTTTVVPLTTVGSAYFDGTGDYLTVPYSSNFDLSTGDWTMEAWFNARSFASGMSIIGKDTAGTNFDWNMGINNSTTLSISTAGTAQILTATVPTMIINTWYHYAICRTGTATRIFLNGIQYATSNLGLTNASATTPTIGCVSHNAPGGFFNGYIADLRVIKGTGVYTTPFAPPTQSLTAVTNTKLLTLQTQQPSNNSQFVDNSSARNLITRFGNTTQGSFAPYGANWSTYFDGTGDWITVTAGTQWQFTGDYTLEAWIYVTVLTYGLIFGTGGSGSADQLTYTDTGQLYFAGVGTATGLITTNNWIHVAASRSGTTQKLFINGVVQSTATVSGTIGQNLAGYIGRRNDTYSPVNGYISNLRIVNGTALYTANFTPQITPLTPVTNTVLLTCQDARFVDNSPNNNVVSNVGDTKIQRFSPYGATIQTPTSYSQYFDGTGDYLTVPANNAFVFGTGDYTVEAWIYTPSFTPNSYIVQNLSVGNVSWGLEIYNNLIRWVHMSPIILSATAPSVNSWHHVAVARSGTTLSMFIDGVRGATATDSTNLSSNNPVLIGHYPSLAYTGNISNLRIVKGTAVYNPALTTCTVPTGPLIAVANTSLLTCQSTTFIDNSTNAFAITATGDTRPRAFNPFGYTNTQGSAYTPALYGASGYFDGSGDYLQLATNNSQFNQLYSTTVPFTIECWVYMTVKSADANTFISTYGGGGAYGWRIELHPDGNVYWVSNGANTAIIYAVPLNSWNHLAFVWNGTTIKMYLNGVNVVSGATSWTNNTEPLWIGSMQASGTYAFPYFGYISDVRITRARQVYTSNFVPPQSPLTTTTATTLLLNMDKAAVTDYTKSVNLETVGDAKITTESAYNGLYYSNYFDGTGDYLDTPSSTALAFGTGDWEYSFWYNAISTSGYLFDTRTGSATGLTVYYQSPTYSVYVNNSTVITGTDTAKNTWHYLTLSKVSGSTRLFVDGTQIGSTYTDANNYVSGTIRLGCRFTTITDIPFNGWISNFKVVKGIGVATQTVPTVPATPTTNTQLLTCQSNRFIDNSVNNLAITRTGDVVIRSVNPFQRNTKTSMYFDGTGDYLTNSLANPISDFGTGDFTVEFWMNASPTGTFVTVGGTQSIAGFGTPGIWRVSNRYNSANGIYFNYTNGSAFTDLTFSTTNYNDGTWHHIAATRASGTLRMFVDGISVGTPTAVSQSLTSGQKLFVGYNVQDAAYYTGYVEDLRITKGVARYTANFTPPTAKLQTK